MSKIISAASPTRRPAARGPRPTTGVRIFRVVNGIVLTGFALACLIPFLNVLGSSFATPGELATRPPGRARGHDGSRSRPC